MFFDTLDFLLLFLNSNVFKAFCFWMDWKATINKMFIFATVGHLCGTRKSSLTPKEKPNAPNSGFYLKFFYLVSNKTPFLPNISGKKEKVKDVATKPPLSMIIVLIVTKLTMFWNGCIAHYANIGSVNDASMHSFIEVMCNNYNVIILISFDN